MDTALDMFAERVAASGNNIALKTKTGGSWVDSTWKQLDEAVTQIAAGLGKLGLNPGDRANIISNTNQSWIETDLGILRAGGVTVPIYQSNLPHECSYITNDSGARFIFAEDTGQLDKLKKERDNLKGVEKVILFSGSDSDEWVMTLDELKEQGKAFLAENAGFIGERNDAVKPESLMTIVYTSGTTGPPKGVVLTHKNFVSECNALKKVIDVEAGDMQMMFLPMAHIFAKIMMYITIRNGCPVAFAESIEKLVDNIGEIKPTWMGSVPRIYEKVYSKVTGDVERAGGLKAKIFNWSMGVGSKVSALRQNGKEPGGWLGVKYSIANKLVFSKLKTRFGGRIRFFVSGGAPLAKELAEFFHAADLLVLEGYGLTETTAATHVNRPDKYKFGTVGPAIPGVEVKIADDGEILVKGPNIMREYYNKPEATKEVISDDGWFHTGDIGEVDKEGFLRITDRKKDLIVTAGGKNVAPQNIENLMKQSLYISQIMVHGDKRKFLSAVICPDEPNCNLWLQDRGKSPNGPLRDNTEIKRLIEGEIEKFNKNLASYETIKKFVLARKEFEVGDELTPTMKVKRKVVNDMYKDDIEALYPKD